MPPKRSTMQSWLNTRRHRSMRPTNGISKNLKRNTQHPPKVGWPFTFATPSQLVVTRAESKRSKLENETPTPIRSGIHEQNEGVRGMQISSAHSEIFSRHHRSESSLSIGHTRLSSGPSYPSEPTLLASHSLSGFDSPPSQDLSRPVNYVVPQLEADRMSYNFFPNLRLVIGTVLQCLLFSALEPPIPEGKVRARWKCVRYPAYYWIAIY
jgi:hypothetical protein